MGSPLDFVVGVRLDPGEVLRPECISAEVTVGEATLPRFAVVAALESAAGTSQVRVRTVSNIDEPVVAVSVNIGCESKVSRRFTLFADPPGMNIGTPPLADVQSVTAAPVPAPSPSAPPEAAVGSAVAQPLAPREVRASTPASPRRATVARKPPRKRAAAAPAAVRPAAAAPQPRLTLDTPVISVAAAAAVVSAASAAEREAVAKAAEREASAAQAAATATATASAFAASARLAAMEQDLAALRKESQTNRELMGRLSRALADAEDRSRWLPMLLAGLLALVGLVIWLAYKLRRTQVAQDAAWWSTAAPAATQATALAATTATMAAAQAAAPKPAIESVPVGLPAQAPLPAAAVAAAAARDEVTFALAPRRLAAVPTPLSAVDDDLSTQRTVPMPASMVNSVAQSRDVSIEELLDLEQQAEFFVVLGQDEAAIDLLVGHLRSSGGTVPLPYLKLMEIYRRRGDEAAYERTRDRFNHRFNAVAPGWDTDLQSGRALVEYPDVMAQIERNWPTPMDAMATLETQLFRTDGSEMFELPAYREVLFLYSLARDLLEQSDRNGARVDVLLPLVEGTDYATTAALPYLGDDRRGTAPVDIVVEDLPTAPIDLDLDPGAPRGTSQFGFFEDPKDPKDPKDPIAPKRG